MKLWYLLIAMAGVYAASSGTSYSISQRVVDHATMARVGALERASEENGRQLDELSRTLIPKLDEVLTELRRRAESVEQHQEQHIHVPSDPAAIERERLRGELVRDIAHKIMKGQDDAVQ